MRLARIVKRAQRIPSFKPFLAPVSPSGNKFLQRALLPLGTVIGVARVLVLAAVGLLYFLLDSIFSILSVSSLLSALQKVGSPNYQVVPPVKIVKRLVAAIFARLILLILGFWWIPAEVVNRKRGYVTRKYRASYVH